MMGVAELEAYFVRIQLPEAGRWLIEKARREAPVRQVQSRLGNVLTRFPSRKMQRTLVTESRTVEFPALVQYEHDPDVLEYYAQPVRLAVRMSDVGTKKSNIFRHLPDFLLLRKTGACMEEWREEARLQKLATRHPDRFTHTERGWVCPPIESHLQSLGIQYRLRTPSEHPEVLVQNLLFLGDYNRPDTPAVSAAALRAIHRCLREHGAMPLADLIAEGKSAEVGTFSACFTADDLYKAIAGNLVSYDLWNEPLSDLTRSKVYRDAEALEFSRSLKPAVGTQCGSATASIEPGQVISYDGHRYTTTLVGKDHVALVDDGGSSTEVAITVVQGLYQKGRINISCDASRRVDAGHAYFSELSPDEVTRAIERGRALDMPLEDALARGISSRTLRRWRNLVRAAGASGVGRNLALVGQIRNRGNRNRKLPEAVLSLIERVAAETYNQPASVTTSSAYRRFVSECYAANLRPCSYRSFRREIQGHESVRLREGKRSAYQRAPIVWYLSARDPIHGVRPFEYVHIDHTPLDILLVCGETGQLLGRPWLSLAVDAESRAIVGFYLSFESPSYRSCMMVVRDIVRGRGRMPGTLVVDNGAEFRSAALQRLCELYAVTLRYRPAGQPRHGSVMERVFGTAHSQLIHNLRGNTKQLKNPRVVTKSTAPERHAEWTLPSLYGALSKYFRDLYGTELHPAHGESPERHLEMRLAETGERLHRMVRLDRTFLIETCPPADQSGERQVDVRRGVKVNHLWYWTDAFRSARIDGLSVPVRVDPWDVRFCYVLIGQDWHQCVCKLGMALRRLTRVELESYFEEMTKRRGLQRRELTPERIGEWMQVLDRHAFDQRLQKQQAETRLIYDALNLTTVEPAESSPVMQSQGPGCDDSSAPEVAREDDEYDLY